MVQVADLDPGTKWKLKQELAKPGMYYGNGGTIHGTGWVDVETDKDGNVVAVWFRCMMLPFKQHTVSKERAAHMREANVGINVLTGVEIILGNHGARSEDSG